MQFFKQLTDPALKRLYKFVLKRMIGRFLATNELDLDQLDVHLRAGRIELCDLELDANVLNTELCEAYGLPFRVQKGYLGSVRVAISYANIMSESCLVEVDDIEIVLAPLSDVEFDAASRPSQEARKSDEENEEKSSSVSSASASTTPEPVDDISQEGLDFVANWIEQVTSKIKVTFSNICISLTTGTGCDEDIALALKLEWAQVTDESASEVQSAYGRSSLTDPPGMQDAQGGMFGSFQQQSMAGSTLFGISQKAVKFHGISIELESRQKDSDDLNLSHSILTSDASKACYIQLKLSHYEAVQAPTVDADVFLHSVRAVLQPQDFIPLGKLIDTYSQEPSQLRKKLVDGDFGSTSMFDSVCDGKPQWMAGNEQAGGDDEEGAVDLSFKEFQRIEQLLQHYRQTRDELRKSRVHTDDREDPPSTAAFARKLSAVDSVESVGLSDLEDEDDGFFDAETGTESMLGGDAQTTFMNESIYASAINDETSSQGGFGMSKQDRASKRLQSRVKVHLLECDAILLYEDLFEDEAEPTEEEKPLFRKPPVSVKGQERLILHGKDLVCSCLMYPRHVAVSCSVGSLDVNEKFRPRTSMSDIEEEDSLLEVNVLGFAEKHPLSGKRVHMTSALTAQIRLDFDADSEAKETQSLSIQMNTRPVLLEWDMYLLDRAHNYMDLMEQHAQAKAKDPVMKVVQDYPKTLELSTDCVEAILRFPMVSSDAIRHGPSSNRGLCEDRMVVLLHSVHVTSDSSNEKEQSDRRRLEWLSEFDLEFTTGRVTLLTPTNGDQRLPVEEYVLLDGREETSTSDKCRLKLRLQTPTRSEIQQAMDAKDSLSQDSSQNIDKNVSSDSNPTGEDNDGGRVGLNGWNLDALARCQHFEKCTSAASLFCLDIVVPHADIGIARPTLARLMVLIDALLLINPLDVNGYNQSVASSHGRKLPPCYMSVNVLLQDGTLTLQDNIQTCSKTQETLFKYHFAYESVRIFQVSQWMSQLTSRLHASAQNVTLLEENGDSKEVLPIIYKTPFGISSAPMLFVGVDIIDQTQEMREMKVEMHLSNLSLRYDATSKWLLQFLDMILIDYPAPIIPLDSGDVSEDEVERIRSELARGECEVVKLATPPRTIFTKLFVNMYDGLVDYAPPDISSRVIVVVGNLCVSSNVVTGAQLQGYKIIASDLQLFLTEARSSYDEIDRCVLGNELYFPEAQSLQRGNPRFACATARQDLAQVYPSLLMFLEKSGFLQLATMDFIDIFLRIKVPETTDDDAASSDFPELSVELNLGTANLYVCFDSFNTLVEAIGKFTDDLAIEQTPTDTTGYVGFDKDQERSSVSVATNLQASPNIGSSSSTSPPTGMLKTESRLWRSDVSESRSERGMSVEDLSSGRDSDLNVMQQIEENAFGGMMNMPETKAATDTEARLLRTRLNEMKKQKERMVGSDVETESYMTSRIGQQEEEKPRVRINELVIENYYAQGQQEDTNADFLMDLEEKRAPDPWFDNTSQRDGSCDEGNAKWLGMHEASSPHSAASSSPDFEAVDDNHEWRSFHSQRLLEDSDEESDVFDPNANGKSRWWGRQHEFELSELQTEETASSFSRHMDQLDDEGYHPPESQEAMSMSILCSGENEDGEDAEVELDFELDKELQTQFSRLLSDSDNEDDDLSDLSDARYRQESGKPSVSSSSPRNIPSQSFTSSQVGSTTESSVRDEPTARWFYDEDDREHGTPTGPPSRIYPHHIEIPIGGAGASLSFGEKEMDDAIRSIAKESAAMKVETSTPVVVTNVLLRDFNLCVRFFGGSDWIRSEAKKQSEAKPPTSQTATSERKQPAKKEKLLDALLDDYVPSSTHLFEEDDTFSIHTDTKTQTRKRSMKSGRKTEEMLEMNISRVQLRVDRFNEAESQPLASSLVLALGDLELLDYISTSQIRKIICYWKSDTTHRRESDSSMVHVHLMTVRPGQSLCEEHRLKVKLLPLRINLDQEVVAFLRQFVPEEDATSRPRRHSSFNEQDVSMEEGTELPTRNVGSDVALGSWFFQSIDIRPCKIKIDYRPTHVNYRALREGDYLEVINLFVLEGMELVLHRVKMSGVDGWKALGDLVLGSWVNDISRHQLHKCVASVSLPPLRPFVNVGSGAADLILLPLEHYGKDRRLVRGLKKGARSFLRSLTVETLNTASKVAQGTQALLQHADDVVSASSSSRKRQIAYRQSGSRIKRNSKRLGGGGIRQAQESGGGIGSRQYLAQQPSNASEGLYQAYDSFSRELQTAAKTIVAVPLVEYKKTGSQGYARSVIRAVPVAVLRPMIGATEAMSKALIGARNGVDPELMEDIQNKFKDFS